MGVAFETTTCVQDQYGNQYNYNLDPTHQYITGSAVSAQGCSGGTWPLLGSYTYTEKGILVEFTLVGDGFTNCPFELGTRVNMRLVHAFQLRDGKICRENGYEIWRRA